MSVSRWRASFQMRWEEPLVVQGVHDLSDQALADVARTYRARVEALVTAEEAA